MPSRGRPPGSEVKPWQDAIRRAVRKRALDGGKAIDKLARSLVAQGLEGNISALTEIGNRLDGKASQPIEHSGQVDVAMTLDRLIERRREQELSMREAISDGVYEAGKELALRDRPN